MTAVRADRRGRHLVRRWGDWFAWLWLLASAIGIGLANAGLLRRIRLRARPVPEDVIAARPRSLVL